MSAPKFILDVEYPKPINSERNRGVRASRGSSSGGASTESEMSGSTKASSFFLETIKDEDFLLAVCDAVIGWQTKYPYNENSNDFLLYEEVADQTEVKKDSSNDATIDVVNDVVNDVANDVANNVANGEDRNVEHDDKKSIISDATDEQEIVKEVKVEEKNGTLPEEEASEWLTTGSEYVGRYVKRKFGKKHPIIGVIVGWLPADGEDIALWHVEHVDGDEEDLEEFEVKKYILPVDDPEAVTAAERRATKLEKIRRRKLNNLKLRAMEEAKAKRIEIEAAAKKKEAAKKAEAKKAEAKKAESKSVPIIVPEIKKLTPEEERDLQMKRGKSMKSATINWKQVEEEFKLNNSEYRDHKRITPFFLRAIWKYMAYGDVVDRCYSHNVAYDSDLDDVYLQPLEAAERFFMDRNNNSIDSTRVLGKRPRVETFSNIGRTMTYEPKYLDKSLDDPRIVTNAKAFVRVDEHNKQWTLPSIMALPLSHTVDSYSTMKRLRLKIDSEAVFTFNVLPPLSSEKAVERKVYEKKKYIKKEK